MARRKQTNNLKSSPKGMYVLALSIVAAAAMITLSDSKSSSATARQEPSEIVVGQFDTVKVPVPASPVRAGERLESVTFSFVRYPSHQVPKDAITDVTPYLKGVAIAPLPANLPLYKSNISLSASASNPVIEKIPQGMRAITVRADATTAVEGWAAAGAIVDVLLVTKERSSVVAEMVKILSAERNTTSNAVASPEIPSTVTLLVSQEQALAINTATNNGKIAFALRSLNDSENWGVQSFDSSSLNRSASSSKPSVGGYIKVDGKEGFTLVDGKWVSTSIKPEGFFPGNKE